jgi:hypothetical protein
MVQLPQTWAREAMIKQNDIHRPSIAVCGMRTGGERTRARSRWVGVRTVGGWPALSVRTAASSPALRFEPRAE